MQFDPNKTLRTQTTKDRVYRELETMSQGL